MTIDEFIANAYIQIASAKVAAEEGEKSVQISLYKESICSLKMAQAEHRIYAARLLALEDAVKKTERELGAKLDE